MYGSEIQTDSAPCSPGSGRSLFSASHIVTTAEKQPAMPIPHNTTGLGARAVRFATADAAVEVSMLLSFP